MVIAVVPRAAAQHPELRERGVSYTVLIILLLLSGHHKCLNPNLSPHLAPVEGGGGPVDGIHLGDGGPRVSRALAGAVSHQGSVVGCGLY